MTTSDKILAFVPVSRGRALGRALVRLLGGVVPAVTVWSVLDRLHFVPSGVSNRVVDYALAIAMIPFAIGALYLFGSGLRWLLLVVWPGHVGMTGRHKELELRLGPFGRWVLDAARLSIRYPHELDEEDADDTFERLVEPALLQRTRLPRMEHPDYPGRVNWLIQRFGPRDEEALASMLLPFVQEARQERAGRESDE
jgi:hypothetical protein